MLWFKIDIITTIYCLNCFAMNHIAKIKILIFIICP